DERTPYLGGRSRSDKGQFKRDALPEVRPGAPFRLENASIDGGGAADFVGVGHASNAGAPATPSRRTSQKTWSWISFRTSFAAQREWSSRQRHRFRSLIPGHDTRLGAPKPSSTGSTKPPRVQNI